MNRLIFVAVVLLFPIILNAQSRTVSGQLTDEDGQPIPQVTILIKGTTTAAATDADGFYSIVAPIGSTLIFRFLGYVSREVLVTETGLEPTKPGSQRNGKRKRRSKRHGKKEQVSIFQDSLPSQESGMAILTEQSDRHSYAWPPDPRDIKSIKVSGGKHRIKLIKSYARDKNWSLAYISSFGLEKVGRLPQLQNRYAQGRSLNNMLTWRGADQGEIYSWGPTLNTLSFDGSTYPFDQNGRLEPNTTDANRATSYNALALFRTAFDQAHQVKIDWGNYTNNIGFDLEYREQQGVLHGSQSDRLNASITVKQNLGEAVWLDSRVLYNRSEGRLLNRGAHLSTLIGGMYRSAATFDNFNALNANTALLSRNAYRLPDGTVRSHAPGLVDNPVGVISEFPNQTDTERLMAGLGLRAALADQLELSLKTDIDRQHNDSNFGIAPGYSGALDGIFTHRNHRSNYVFNRLMGQFDLPINKGEMKFRAGLNHQFFEQSLQRTDAFGFLSPNTYPNLSEADALEFIDFSLHRTIYEPFIKAQFKNWDGLNFGFTNRAYFSNTLSSDLSHAFLPSIEGSIDFTQLIYGIYLNELKFYFNAGRSLRESSLLYNDWSYGSLNTSVNDYSRFYQTFELTHHEGLTEEVEWKFEAGINFDLDARLQAEFTYYRNRTDDLIAPVWTQGSPLLSNVATVLNEGLTAVIKYNSYYYHRSGWSTSLALSLPRSRVLSLNGNANWVPLAGFTEIQTVLAEGEDVGSLYGSAFLRDEDGNLIIDNTGFPIKDPELRNLGSSIPDFTLSWSGEFIYRRFNVSFLVDMSHGGEQWNGTQAMLDYLGRSDATAEQRTLTEQSFEGVAPNGDPITSSVSFYNPSLGLQNNRWVRYGPDGVGEEYIQDASWIRLQQLRVNYIFPFKKSQWIEDIQLSFIGQNLFLVTPYTGSDPTATLFGQANSTGLDLFNMPSARSYSLQFSIKF